MTNNNSRMCYLLQVTAKIKNLKAVEQLNSFSLCNIYRLNKKNKNSCEHAIKQKLLCTDEEKSYTISDVDWSFKVSNYMQFSRLDDVKKNKI